MFCKYKQSMLLCILLSIVLAKRYNIILNTDQMIYSTSKHVHDEINSMLNVQDIMEKTYELGYIANLSEETAKKIKKHPKVAVIEEDMEIRIATANIKVVDNSEISYSESTASINFEVQENTPWGLSRLIKPYNSLSTDYSYEYITNSSPVYVYVLDTGIQADHPEFEGRAEFGYNNVQNSLDIDENGHGTHCAGIIGSRTYGVAKNVNLIGVKVLDKHGVGSISKLIDGIEFISRDVASRKGRFIVNMSVGGEKSAALNYIIKYVSKKRNIHFSSAAGNENKDACKFSPSSSSSFTIGASDENNRAAVFSNEGRCVDIFAPGTNILSTWINNEVRTLSGTSMAAPHVSGVMAVYLGLVDFKPHELKKTILRDAISIIQIDIFGFLTFFNSNKALVSLTKLYDRLKQYNKLNL